MQWSKLAIIVITALALMGCAQTSYLTKEYGDARRDGEVTTADGSTYWIWINRNKPKLVISVSAGRAMGTGFAQGLTLGAVQERIPEPVFEQAVRQWFDENGRKECRTTRGYQIDERIMFEFEYVCGSAANGARSK
jgi:hypothetical protein